MIRWIANQKGTNYSSGAEKSKCNKFDFVRLQASNWASWGSYLKSSYALFRLVLSRIKYTVRTLYNILKIPNSGQSLKPNVPSRRLQSFLMAELNQPGRVITIWITRKSEGVFADLNHFSLMGSTSPYNVWVILIDDDWGIKGVALAYLSLRWFNQQVG